MSRLCGRAGPFSTALIGMAIAAPALAQDPGSRQTREFVQAAAQSDQFEIMEATAVLAQSQDRRVRSFAQAMLDAHRQTSTSLLQAVSKAALKPSLPGLSNDQSQFLAALQSERGAELDKAYVKQQVLAHHAALAIDQAYAETGDDAAIKAAAAATVPVVTAHLQMIEQLRQTQGS